MDPAAQAVKAVVSGDEAAVTSLLDAGVSPNTTSTWGDPLLHVAIACGHDQIEKLLLSRGATPFDFASAEAAAAVDATKSGDLARLTSLLDGGVDVDTRNELGDPLLHVAAWKGHCSLVSLLLSRGADTSALGRLGRNPLMRAAQCKRDNRAVIVALCGAGVQVNEATKDEYRETALILACRFSTAGTVAALLDAGADMEQKDGDGDRALHRAAKSGKPDIISLLLARGADVGALGELGRTALMSAAACDTDNRAVVAALCGAGAQVNEVSEDEDKTTALILACSYGTAGTVAALLNAGADIEQENGYGDRALHRASLFGKPDVVSLLLARGADIEALGEFGQTSLLSAGTCKSDNRAVVAALCGAGAQVNAVSSHEDRDTALILACELGTAGTVAALLDAGADMEQKNGRGDRALHVAALSGKRDIVSLLLARGADVGALGLRGRTSLMSAVVCDTDNRAVVAALCGAGAQVNAVSEHKEKTTALILACTYSTAGTVAALLDAGADMEQKNGRGDRALHLAALSGKPDVVSLLLARGADVAALGQLGRTALMAAAEGATDNRAMVAALCGAGAQVNAVSEHEAKTTALILACDHGTAGTVAALLDAGADIEQEDGSGYTGIILAAFAGKTDTVDLLLQRGADIHAKNNDGYNAIIVAAFNGKTDTVDLLLQRGADIHSKNNDGVTPLFMSSQSGAVESAKILIAKGAKLNARNDDKVTPLAVASENNKHEIVTLLLKHNADPDLADREGLTALHKSVLQNNVESFKLLIAAGVKLDVQSITGCTELHYATKDKRLEMLNMLVNAKCNTNVEDHLGNVPLHVAALNSDVDSLEIYKQIVSILLSNKANINHINNCGESPIAISTVTLNLEMMKFLHAKNGDLKCLDSMDRSLIHKAVEALIDAIVLTDAKVSTGKLFIEWLVRQGLSINAQDVNLQTPLHLAAKAGKEELVEYLIGEGADVTARDSFGHLPLMCALKHSSVFQYLWNPSIEHLNDKDFCTLQRLTYWLGLGDDLMNQIKKDSKTHVPLENMPQKVQPLKCTYDAHLARWLDSDSEELPDFMSDWLSSLQHLTYIDHPTLNDVMWDFLKHLQEGVRKEDPLVAYLITRCGSVDEKTKVFAQDECDCSCVQENIKFHMFEEPTKPDHEEWTAFVHMKCKDKYVDQRRRILDKQNRLSQGKLCHYFGKAIARVLSNAKFWRRYPQLQRITPKDISAGDRRICTMHVIWSDEICPFLMIDIDLAPVVDLKSWKPSWCNPHPLMHLIKSIALPKWKITPDVDMDLMEIGVHGWGPLFHKMPEQMRQGYRLAKVVRGSAVCPKISLALYEWCDADTFMNTYLLKQVIMHEFQAWYDQKEDGLEPQVHTDIYWARRIYEKMEEAFKSRKLYSWYIPSYNLLTDDKFKYKDIAVMYAKLCRRLLTEEAAVHFRKAYMGGPVDATLDMSRLAISHS